MIEYLEKLIEDQEWELALVIAERLLLRTNPPLDLLAINCAILWARYSTGEYHGSIAAGEVALKLGAEIKSWDYYGTACLNLAAAHVKLLQYGAAIDVLNGYVERISLYTTAAKLEAAARYNLGISHKALGNDREALQTLMVALNVAQLSNNHRFAHGIRHVLVELYLKTAEFDPIPRLLAQSAKYLRHNKSAHMIKDSRLHYLRLRADFALRTSRLQRAMLLSLRGLQLTEGLAAHNVEFHLLIGRIDIQLDSLVEALGHALAARIYAIKCRRHDLESEALSLSYELSKKNPGAARQLEQFYLYDQVDLANSQDYI